MLLPLTCHWKDGAVPPLTGEAVKVTWMPAQMVLSVAVMATETIPPGLTVTRKSVVSPRQSPAAGVIWYVTMPGVARLLKRTWSINCPESALNPDTLPEVRVAVQKKFAVGILEVRTMFVDSPVHMYLERGSFVMAGARVNDTITVSETTQ